MENNLPRTGLFRKFEKHLNTFVTFSTLGSYVKNIFENPNPNNNGVTKILSEGRMSLRAKISEGGAIFEHVINNVLTASEKEAANEFQIKLHQKDPSKAESLVLWISSIVQLKKDQASIEEGFKHGAASIRNILAQKGTTREETLQKRIDFLEGKNAFSFVPKSKKGDFLFNIFLFLIVLPIIGLAAITVVINFILR